MRPLIAGCVPPRSVTEPPTAGSALRLIALNPGSREYLRASVDYDGIGATEPDRFNLVIQRVRSAASELIEDQEIFRRGSILPDSGRFIVDVLLESRLVRVTGPALAQALSAITASNEDEVAGATVKNGAAPKVRRRAPKQN